MPLHFCHPNTPHRKLRMPEWFVSSLMMDRALDAIVRRAKTLDRKHDIPYLAGYSKDGKTIYIDRHMPSSFRYDGRDINTDRYLILHEEVEKTLIDQLNLHYLHAHQIATRAEQAAVRAAGVRWRDYDRFMQKYVKRIGDEQLTKVPSAHAGFHCARPRSRRRQGQGRRARGRPLYASRERLQGKGKTQTSGARALSDPDHDVAHRLAGARPQCADHLQRSAIWPKQNHLTILPRIVFMSACVSARRVCVRTFPRAPVLNPSAVMEAERSDRTDTYPGRAAPIPPGTARPIRFCRRLYLRANSRSMLKRPPAVTNAKTRP